MRASLILVVEDNLVNEKFAVMALEGAGRRVLRAAAVRADIRVAHESPATTSAVGKLR